MPFHRRMAKLPVKPTNRRCSSTAAASAPGIKCSGMPAGDSGAVKGNGLGGRTSMNALMLKRTKLAGIRQPGKKTAAGASLGEVESKGGEMPTKSATPQPAKAHA